MPSLCVIDTMVLRKANAPLDNQPPKEGRAFAKRVALLRRIRGGELQVLISSRLMQEYRQQVLQPRNDVITAFFALLDDPNRSRPNWASWSGAQKAQQAKCRFPGEDTHVLRTAHVEGESSTIFSEESRMLKTDACIHRTFGVHIQDPTK